MALYSWQKFWKFRHPRYAHSILREPADTDHQLDNTTALMFFMNKLTW